MTIETRFGIGDKVRHKRMGEGEIFGIDTETNYLQDIRVLYWVNFLGKRCDVWESELEPVAEPIGAPPGAA